MSIEITKVEPTPFMQDRGNGLEQLIQLDVANSGRRTNAVVSCCGDRVVALEPGTNHIEHFLAVEDRPVKVELRVAVNDHELRRELLITPPRKWTVHLVHLSHHDLGYTDLDINVLDRHRQWLSQAVEFAAVTRDYPDAARFRIVLEQSWSVLHFLRVAPEAERNAMLELLRSGQFELTALFGNMTTEICGHESLLRAAYPSFKLAREHGITIASAEHNDIPGFTSGLARVLVGAGVEFFCPGIPNYYGWGNDLPSFWDEEAVFGYAGMPGAFWWEAPGGGRVLFWSNNSGCGGDCRVDLPGLPGRLSQLQEEGYPYDVLRWPVSGAACDNSPYVLGYSDTVRAWNERWAWPRLEMSTDVRFCEALVRQLPADLPVWQGGIPGQDYPLGAMSTARATGVNRRNHARLVAAESLSAMAALFVAHPYAQDRLRAATEEILLFDEHTWGHHFPCGPTADAAKLGKMLHAHRAAALLHDVESKAMSAIADSVGIDGDAPHLVVFNPSGHARSGWVRSPLREIDNCGEDLIPSSDGSLRPVILNSHWHVNLPDAILDGKFELIDAETGTFVPHQLTPLTNHRDPVAHAAERCGLGVGSKRYGIFEVPRGLLCDVEFMAEDVPGFGWRCYRLQETDSAPAAAPVAAPSCIENEIYRIEFTAGDRIAIVDKRLQQDIADPDAEVFGTLVRREGDAVEKAEILGVETMGGPLSQSLILRQRIRGCPDAETRFTLRKESPDIEVSIYVLKDATPGAETLVAFPFHLPDCEVDIETPLAVERPGENLLPGAYSNRLSVADWLWLRNGVHSVLWFSADSLIVSLGQLWPDRISPAHACRPGTSLADPPQTARDFCVGRVYATLFANNFGTNFYASQDGGHLFRFVFRSDFGQVMRSHATRFGESMAMPFRAILTHHSGDRTLMGNRGLLEIDNPAVRCLACKRAEAGNHWTLRLWNQSDTPQTARLTFGLPIRGIMRIDAVEMTELGEIRSSEYPKLNLAAGEWITLRIEMENKAHRPYHENHLPGSSITMSHAP